MPADQTITIRLNGEKCTVSKGARVVDLLNELKIVHPAIAVEVNAQITPRNQFESTLIRDDDVVEIVSLVGGG